MLVQVLMCYIVDWLSITVSSFAGVGLSLSLEHLIDSLEYRSFDLQLFGLIFELIALWSSVDLHLSAYLWFGRLLLPEPILELSFKSLHDIAGSQAAFGPFGAQYRIGTCTCIGKER